MTDRHVYTEDGQRLYTTAQLAAELGITPEAVRVRLHRQQAQPYTRLDGRTPLWTLPRENTMASTFDSNDLRDQVTTYTEASEGEYDVAAITEEIIERHGAVRVDDIDSAEFAEIVMRHAVN